MTAPNRRQIMAGSLAAIGAAGAPAIATAETPARDNLDLLDYLPEEFRFLAYMRWLKEQPVETRLEFVAMCEGGGFETEAIDTFKRCLDLPAYAGPHAPGRPVQAGGMALSRPAGRAAAYAARAGLDGAGRLT